MAGGAFYAVAGDILHPAFGRACGAGGTRPGAAEFCGAQLADAAICCAAIAATLGGGVGLAGSIRSGGTYCRHALHLWIVRHSAGPCILQPALRRAAVAGWPGYDTGGKLAVGGTAWHGAR